MAVGQAVLAPAVLDVAAVRRIEERVEDRERSRSVAHAEQLADLLALERVYDDAGMALGATAEIALLLRCSEYRAGALLSDAQVLDRLGALPVMASGLLTIEQARVVVEVLGRLDDVGLAASLWERLRLRLLADADRGCCSHRQGCGSCCSAGCSPPTRTVRSRGGRPPSAIRRTWRCGSATTGWSTSPCAV